MEKITIWGYTDEEINSRWKVHMMFDPISRLFGTSDEDDSPAGPVVPSVNSDQMMANLENMLTQG